MKSWIISIICVICILVASQAVIEIWQSIISRTNQSKQLTTVEYGHMEMDNGLRIYIPHEYIRMEGSGTAEFPSGRKIKVD